MRVFGEACGRHTRVLPTWHQVLIVYTQVQFEGLRCGWDEVGVGAGCKNVCSS